ncbi:acyl-CoA dehydrogenase family protein [Amycolatopsis alba]|uniref:Isobutylamine N-hydroxylase n=1 Tax=Amycolatopsis alba DSM 44262 TaxID=1125972 RepID=A0A229REX8_AMYAL|nr:acyl-CoA dehydrogenase family protein [Amycolatopsis alba]OXM45197.1 isobutylamine N-hydroxylase [Amycolatopsis alba DSM 44262]
MTLAEAGKTSMKPETKLLSRERATLRRFLPALADKLAGVPLLDLERPGNESIRLFREADGTALLAPVELGGLGARALDAVQVQRALGTASPSLAAGTTMHHLSLATLLEHCQEASEAERELIAGVVRERLLLASGFAEGRTGGSVFAPTMRAVRRGGDYVINGSKKPCSLSRSMDLLLATVSVEDGGAARRGIALIPAGTPGIARRPFWESWILAGAESDEVVLDDVVVPGDLVLLNEVEDPTGQHELTGFLWFGLMISSTYLGAASALLERLLLSGKADPATYSGAAGELEAAMSAIEGIARAMDDGERGQDISARLLFTRTALHGALTRAAATMIEALGGMAFIGTSEISYLAAAVHAFGFHPPSRRSVAGPLAAYHAGSDLELA